jgi:hypothetical protein
MSDSCEFLERRHGGDDAEFDGERPYCTAVDAFVQPMRADVCTKRYGLDPETDCEFYREAKGLGSITGFEGADGEGESGTEEAGS